MKVLKISFTSFLTLASGQMLPIDKGAGTQGSLQSPFYTENALRSWKCVHAPTPTTNPGTSSVSPGFQELKEHQDTRDSYVCRFIHFDKSDQAH